MLKTTMILKMQGYWAVGSGKGGGNEVDNRIDRDSDGLPYVPGKMLKGLIKDACVRLYNAGNENYSFVKEIFGSSEKSNGLNRTKTSSGKIYISDARLSSMLRSALAKEDNATAKNNLTRNIYSTAIDNISGTAKKASLRGYEVAVPMELYATIECDCAKEILDFIKLAATKLVYAVGSHKTRGLGEVVIEFKDEV
jgi:CRISPR/Cas system CSM-associated protein Csm3 (group 7 of RAMP superfamily)